MTPPGVDMKLARVFANEILELMEKHSKSDDMSLLTMAFGLEASLKALNLAVATMAENEPRSREWLAQQGLIKR